MKGRVATKGIPSARARGEETTGEEVAVFYSSPSKGIIRRGVHRERAAASIDIHILGVYASDVDNKTRTSPS